MESLSLQQAELQMGKESTIRRVKGAFPLTSRGLIKSPYSPNHSPLWKYIAQSESNNDGDLLQDFEWRNK